MINSFQQKFGDWINETILLVSSLFLLLSFLLSDLLVVKIFTLLAMLVVLFFIFIRFRDKKISTRIDEVRKSYSEKSESKNNGSKTVFNDLGDLEVEQHSYPFEDDSFKIVEPKKSEQNIVSSEVSDLEDLKVETILPSKKEEKKNEVLQLEKIYIDKNQSDLNPKQELQKILQSIIDFVHSLTFANSAVLFWVKNQGREISIESYKTNSENFSNLNNFPVLEDKISSVVKSGNGIFIKDFNGIDVPYYSTEKICSLISVPIIYNENSPVAVLAIDSINDDAFGQETVEMVSQCAKLIADLFIAESDKIALWEDKKYFKIHLKMLELLRMHAEIPAFVNTLVDKIAEIINWDAIAVVMFNNDLGAWEVVNTRSRMPGKYFVVKQTIDLKKSIVGKSISENEIKISYDNSNIRLMENESELEISRGRSFASIPISTSSKSYGAFIIETEKSNSFQIEELQTIQRISSTVASAIELQDANDIINNFVIYDELPNVVTYRHFVNRLDEEVKRANDLNLDLTLALFAYHNIEDIESRFGKDSSLTIMKSLASFLVLHKRSYDLIGRFDKNILGVMLVHTPANEGYLWGEKIRSAIAENKIKLNDKYFSAAVTVSICGLKDEMIVDDIINASREVLDKALRVGGNLVSVY